MTAFGLIRATGCMYQFERLYEEGAKRVKIMAIAVHPHISGVPHRIKYFENVFRRLVMNRAWNSGPATRY